MNISLYPMPVQQHTFTKMFQLRIYNTFLLSTDRIRSDIRYTNEN